MPMSTLDDLFAMAYQNSQPQIPSVKGPSGEKTKTAFVTVQANLQTNLGYGETDLVNFSGILNYSLPRRINVPTANLPSWLHIPQATFFNLPAGFAGTLSPTSDTALNPLPFDINQWFKPTLQVDDHNGYLVGMTYQPLDGSAQTMAFTPSPPNGESGGTGVVQFSGTYSPSPGQAFRFIIELDGYAVFHIG